MITHVCHYACACHARGPQVWYPSTPCICIYIYWGVGVSRTEEGLPATMSLFPPWSAFTCARKYFCDFAIYLSLPLSVAVIFNSAPVLSQ